MRAADPILAVSGGSDWRPDVALRALATRTRSVSASAITEVLKDDPTTDEGRAAFAEVCASIKVGLIVQESVGVSVVRICDNTNIWIQKCQYGGWAAVPWCFSGVSAEKARWLICDYARDRASGDDVGIAELRKLAATCGIERPYPRSKAELLDSIRDAGRPGPRTERAASDGAEPV